MGNGVKDRPADEMSEEFRNLINVLEEELNKLPKKEKTNSKS